MSTYNSPPCNIDDEDAYKWGTSSYVFETKPSDGTKYTIQVSPAKYGGLNVICNESSLWRWHGNGDLKFLCGDENPYTREAILKIMPYHDKRMDEIQEGFEWAIN